MKSLPAHHPAFRPAPAPRPTRRAFTLVELLTVIAIIGILAAITLGAVGKVRAQAHQARCGSNIRQIATLAAVWAQENGDWTPPALWGQPAKFFTSQWKKNNGLSAIGFTPALGACGSVNNDDTTPIAEPPHYGINSEIAHNTGGHWGGNGEQHYWDHGRYRFSAILSSRTILFGESKLANPSIANEDTGNKQASFWANFDTFAPRHNGKGYIAYADAHIALKTRQDLRTTQTPNPWLVGITQ
ncbi:MAG: prepilin-type N-terminal cleavage/methylation domain-containing protein [Opitutaceae bacterium]|jgi:prepilin-type N-terminal cleavage/methylation domain-containing protein/prepilin-type processing-associated H-X9-DG protein|nr:prepilin-type N-terminal cleavage/methylation domain-containing protein [Opitutaceae bacterium]